MRHSIGAGRGILHRVWSRGDGTVAAGYVFSGCNSSGKFVTRGCGRCAACLCRLPSPYAGFWLRFVAYLIDAIVLSVVYGVLFLIGIAMVGVESLQSMARGMENGDAAPSAAFIMMMISVLFLGTIASWLYYAYLESSVNQGTLGKMALGLIVTDLQGRRITFGRATGRFFAKIITGLIPLAIGYIMAGFTEKKQALHDMIVSTLVLRKN
jgi:uncharacterized RDD family membrane protein YckC